MSQTWPLSPWLFFSLPSLFFGGGGGGGILVLANNPSEFFDFDGERFSWDGNLGVYHHRTLSLSHTRTHIFGWLECLLIYYGQVRHKFKASNRLRAWMKNSISLSLDWLSYWDCSPASSMSYSWIFTSIFKYTTKILKDIQFNSSNGYNLTWFTSTKDT